MRGSRVLVPRGGKWGAEAADLVRAFGGVPVVAPLIEFAPPEDAAPFEAACRALEAGEYDWLVVTSPRTVEALAERGAFAQVPSAWVAAVGEATAAALEAHGVSVGWMPESESSARAMVREWPEMAPARVLWPRSSEARLTISEGLAELGHAVDAPVAYRTVQAVLEPEMVAALHGGAIDWVLVTAGSVARSLAAQVGAPVSATIATIGPIATADARAVGFEVAIEAVSTSVLAMLEAIVAGREPEPDGGGDDPFAGLFQMPDFPR